ncbi:MAG: ethanolamine ammonia-lyase subunit EutB [Planctomycetaceae bacterium]|nr:ethanolamine ammonia-lyase subunit EutB [Planctomycetaceae bacterium]
MNPRLSAKSLQDSASSSPELTVPQADETLFAYIQRSKGKFDPTFYRQILGAANEFKEGDQAIGVAANRPQSRTIARQLLSQTPIQELTYHSIFEDELHAFIREGQASPSDDTSAMTLGDLKTFLLTAQESDIKEVAARLPSDIIGCVVKLMSNDELIAVGARVFNPLPGSQIGAKGYLGARVQPNSPTDNLDDIRWQVFDAWSYAVGDVLLGTNPVSSDPDSVQAVELALKDLLVTFDLQEHLPHCVLSHIDVQAEVEQKHPASTALWFQSIAGTDSANQTFDLTIEKMRRYARERTGKYGLYFETGQGADFTNGHSHGFDMVLHEARKYGFARRLQQLVAEAQRLSGQTPAPWVHLNDVAGFIGPEVFRTREQLVRCCLEDIVMGKLHGLTIGLDVCSTLHMEVSLEDLDWCLDRIMPANPAYLMALPTKIDPMLGYLTTGYQDHVRLRNKFNYRVNDAMQSFFIRLGVLDEKGEPTAHFGDPLRVYLKYRQNKGDRRPDREILEEGRQKMREVRARGVFLAEGYGDRPGELKPELGRQIQRIYEDAKESLWTELSPGFISKVPDRLHLTTESLNREDYILHPTSGEKLSSQSIKQLQDLKQSQQGRYNVQIVISDGLNSLAISDPGHLDTFLATLRKQLQAEGYRVAPTNLVVTSGRVRAGYRIGETLFRGLSDQRAILHLIGERPGTGHHTFSVYMTAPRGEIWSEAHKTDHNITKVVSGIAGTALLPEKGAQETARLLRQMMSAT